VPASKGELKTLLGRDRFVFLSSVALSFCRALTWVGALPFAGRLVPSGAHASGSQGELKTLSRDRCLSLSAVALSFCRALTWAGALPFAGDGAVSQGAHVPGSQGELKTLSRGRFLFLSVVGLSFCRALTWVGAIPFAGGLVSFGRTCAGLPRPAQNVKP
jgi:hypothetical protein